MIDEGSDHTNVATLIQVHGQIINLIVAHLEQ